MVRGAEQPISTTGAALRRQGRLTIRCTLAGHHQQEPMASSTCAGRRYPSRGVPLRMRVEDTVPYLWRCSPERSGRFLGERRAARQHDVQRAQQLPAIQLASARRQGFFVAPVAVGEPDFLAAGSSQLLQEAINPFRDQRRVMDCQGPAQVRRVHRVEKVLALFPIGGENIP